MGGKDAISKLVDDTNLNAKRNDLFVFDFNGIVKLPEELEIFEASYETKKVSEGFMQKYGAQDWYEWSVKNWGTKWNSDNVKIIDIHENHIALKFDTAWDPPYPIYEKLNEQGLEVHSYWFNDGGSEGDYGNPSIYKEFFDIEELRENHN